MALTRYVIIFNNYTYKNVYHSMDLNIYFLNNRGMRNCKSVLSSTSQLCIGWSVVHVVVI